MKKTFLLKILVGLLGMASISACSVSADSPFEGLPMPVAPQRTITDLPLAGSVQSRYLKLNQGLARTSATGELSLNFIPKEGLDCSVAVVERPYMTAVVPKAAGTYDYDMLRPEAGSQRPVNFVLTDSANNSAINVVADTSTIIIESITDKYISGKLAAKSFFPGYNYDVSGSFQLLNCASEYNQLLKITQRDANVFTPKYSEVIGLNVGGKIVKSLRIMDHTPVTKCNSFSGWYHTEVPIKYLELPISGEVGIFNIRQNEMTIGLEGSQSGVSYQVFEGSGEVIVKDRFSTTVAMSAKDTVYGNYQVIGRITANNCE